MSDIKIIAVITYIIFTVLGGIWGLTRSNSENAQLEYAIERVNVETDRQGKIALVYYCAGHPYLSYDVDQNNMVLEAGAFAAFSVLEHSGPESPFKLGTLTTLMGGAFGGWTIKDVYRFSQASKINIVAKRAITIIVSAVTGFGLGYSLGISAGNFFRNCDSEKMVGKLNSPKFWHKLEENIFRNAVYNISVNHQGAISTDDYKVEVNRIYTSESPHQDINSASFRILQNAHGAKLDFVQNQKWYQKSWAIFAFTLVIGSLLTLGLLLIISRLESR
ncbi:hypothetical protein GCM10028791_37910 [Echinicola sediminis]